MLRITPEVLRLRLRLGARAGRLARVSTLGVRQMGRQLFEHARQRFAFVLIQNGQHGIDARTPLRQARPQGLRPVVSDAQGHCAPVFGVRTALDQAVVRQSVDDLANSIRVSDVMPKWFVENELTTGTVVDVSPDRRAAKLAVNLALASGAKRPARVEQFSALMKTWSRKNLGP